MTVNIKGHKIFIASPGGLETERALFKNTIGDYNEIDAIHRGIHFFPVGWEYTLAGRGRPQKLINDDIRQCDYFVLVLWDRWGSPPNPDGKGKYSSGTDEEYHFALDCIADKNSPPCKIVVFFKAIDPRKLSDPGPQLTKVLVSGTRASVAAIM
ncbi:MAG: DUF4062 domain-containing protein [Sedimenticola sp.]